jgi:parvulin-like peptidyl-prolyl isomerase
MRHAIFTLALAAGLRLLAPAPACAQEVVDRVAARVENDIILLSDVRLLACYQQLVDGKSESDAQILDRLIDQWIVRNEAETARFPRPSEDDIARGLERVQKSFTSAEEYEARKKQVGLTTANIRAMVSAQLYLSNYLDSRFRPSVKIEPQEVQDFYDKAVVPRAQARGQAPPSLDAARDYIHEALVQRSIDDQAERWLNESRGRVRVEKMLEPGAS